MTNKTVTFTFTQTPVMKVSQLTMGPKPVDNATAQDAATVMTDIVKRLLTKLHAKNPDYYTRLTESMQFTASFELPEDGKEFRVRVNGTKVEIDFPLSDETSKSLKATLNKVVRVTTPPKSPYLPASAKQDPLLRPPVNGMPKQARQVTAKNIPPTHNSDTSEKPKSKANVYTPLVRKGGEGTSDLTSASTDQAKADQVVKSGIRPLVNARNICFINAVFQALMNMPDMITTLIEAHEDKIEKETKAIEDLEVAIALEESTNFLPYFFHWSSSPNRVQLRKLETSKEASITLNQALKTYIDGTKKPIWLNPLRGFDPTFGGESQEDASELLEKIFDPLLEPLRNGLDAQGQLGMSIIPANINLALRDSLGRFIPKFGEEKQLVRVVREGDAEVTRNNELEAQDNVSQLPPGGLRKEMGAYSVLPFAIPNAPISLQDLVTEQLTMQKPVEPDNTSVYEADGVKGDYDVTQKRLAIESLNNNAPKYVTLQLKRFDVDQFGKISKNKSAIALPKTNKIRLVVDEKDVDYEIQTLVMHCGSTPKSGHYYSYVRKNDAWFIANDLYVDRLDQLENVETQAYLVFLKRVP